jgi:hypothetical protein
MNPIPMPMSMSLVSNYWALHFPLVLDELSAESLLPASQLASLSAVSHRSDCQSLSKAIGIAAAAAAALDMIALL